MPSDAPRAPATDRRALAVSAALVAAVLAVYAQSLGFDFVNLDDPKYVTSNPVVQEGLSAEGVRWAFGDLEQVGYWMPVTWLSHMLDVELFGMWAGGHHAASVLLHALNAALLFWALQALSYRLAPARAFWVNAFIAAAFALHPLRVESVAWVAERKDVLSTAFALLALRGYARWVRRPGAGRYAAVTAWLALGLLSKPMLVTLPFALLLLDAWPLQRLAPGAPALRAWGRLVLEKLPWIAIALGIALLTLYAKQQLGTAVKSLDAFPPGVRLANALVSYAAYLGLLFAPLRLSAYYPHPGASLPVWKVAGAVLLLLAITGAALAQRRGRPWLAVGWLWFLGTMLPVSGVVQTGSQAMADRFTYLPHIGLLWILGWGGEEMLRRAGAGRRATAALAAALLAALSIRTAVQVGYWRDSVSLFERAIELDAANYLAHNNLGVAYRGRGRTADAEREYRKAIEANPDYLLAYLNMAQVLDQTDRRDEALPYLAVAFAGGLRLDVGGTVVEDTDGLYRAAVRYAASDDPARRRRAIRLFGLLLELDGAYLAESHFQLGRLYLDLGEPEKVQPHADALARLDPERAQLLAEIRGRRVRSGDGG